MSRESLARLTVLAAQVGAASVDCRFTDLLGRWHHVAQPIGRFDGEALASGLAIDVAGLRGWASIDASGLRLRPDLATLNVDVSLARPRLSVVCDLVDPVTWQPCARDPRAVARGADRLLRAMGIAGRVHVSERPGFAGFHAVRDTRLVEMADEVQRIKHVVRDVARPPGQLGTYAPRPRFGDGGSGLHLHLSLWLDGQPLFAGEHGSRPSRTALHATGGVLHHAPVLCAFTHPTENSYRRHAPGGAAAIDAACSFRSDVSCNPYLAFAALLLAAVDGIARELAPIRPAMPTCLDEALVALERDRDFLGRDGVFPVELIDAWVAAKRQYEVDPVPRPRPHPLEVALYADV